MSSCHPFFTIWPLSLFFFFFISFMLCLSFHSLCSWTTHSDHFPLSSFLFFDSSFNLSFPPFYRFSSSPSFLSILKREPTPNNDIYDIIVAIHSTLSLNSTYFILWSHRIMIDVPVYYYHVRFLFQHYILARNTFEKRGVENELAWEHLARPCWMIV